MSLDPTKHQNRISDCHVEAGTINLNPTPSITVGTQVRLTGVPHGCPICEGGDGRACMEHFL